MRNIRNAVVRYAKRYSTLLRLMVVIVLFTILLWNIKLQDIITAFSEARGWFLFYALLLMIPNIFLQAYKWHYIMEALTPRPSFNVAMTSLLCGFFLGATSPGRTGELGRGLFVPGHSVVRVASLTVVDKGMNIITIVVFGLLSLALLLPDYLGVLPLAGEVVLLFGVFNLHRLKPLLERMLHRVTHSERVDNALAAFDAIPPGKLVVLMIVSVAFYLTYAGQFYLMLLCFTDVPLSVAIRTIPVTYLVQVALPITIGDFGIKELTMVKLLKPFGVSGGAAFSATLSNNVMTFLLPSIAGGIIFLFHRPSTGPQDSPSGDHTDHASTRSSHQAVS